MSQVQSVRAIRSVRVNMVLVFRTLEQARKPIKCIGMVINPKVLTVIYGMPVQRVVSHSTEFGITSGDPVQD